MKGIAMQMGDSPRVHPDAVMVEGVAQLIRSPYLRYHGSTNAATTVIGGSYARPTAKVISW
jgi:hypothetical protein